MQFNFRSTGNVANDFETSMNAHKWVKKIVQISLIQKKWVIFLEFFKALDLDILKFILILINTKHFIKIRVMVEIGKQIDLN